MSKLPTVMITGASAGIGAIYADRFSKRGHDLILVSNEGVRLEALANELSERNGTNNDWIYADLTNEAEVMTIETRIREDNQIGILINDAGMSLHGSTLENTHAQLLKLMQLNSVQLALLSAAAAETFGLRRTGSIVNIASVLGLAAAPQYAPSLYSGSKAFVITFTQSLRAELAGTGVYVQCVLPGATRTEIWAKAGMNPDEVPGLMEVDDLVDAALLGYDRREETTIPTLEDEGLWTSYETARQAMLPDALRGLLASRYKPGIAPK